MINPREKLNNKTVLVTGGAGFLGSHLCDRLLHYGAKVICFDNLSTGSKEYVDSKHSNPDFVFALGDANVLSDLEKIFKEHRIDYVFHYAAVVGVQRTVEQPLAVFNDIEGIKNLAEAAVENKVKKIVYSSSSEAYGSQKELPFNEEMSYYDTRHPYALVKATGESFFRSYCGPRGVPVASLRFFNVYGPRQASSRYGFVVGIFISQVLQDMPPTIFRDGSQTRDFTYVDDNVEAVIQALLNENTNGEIINIGTGVETSVLELANKILALSGKKLNPVFLRDIKFSETPRRVADINKMKKLLNYECRMPLEEGLLQTYEWYKNNPQFILRN